MKNKGIAILSIITNIVLIIMLCSFISINGDIVKEKQIIKEMSESTQVAELNNQINALNAEHTEYMNYIQTGKTSIATALANEGVATSNEATLETMAENISKVLQAKTSDATANADNITEGKTAYVNGALITGNGSDNKKYYNLGLSEGKETILRSLYVDSFKSYNVSQLDGTSSTFSIGTGTNSGVSKSGSFNYSSVPIYTNTTPDGNAALLNTITFTLKNSNSNSSNGGTASSSSSYTIYDGDPSDNIVIASGGQGSISVNLFEHTLTNSYITIKASGNGYVRHGTVSKDGVANASASITNIKSNYLTLAYK